MALKAGITAFQFREKGSSQLDAAARVALGQQLQQLCYQFGVPIFVDDDVDLAQQIQADGVHVGQRDQRIEQVLAEVGGQMMVGYSCNTAAQVAHANELAVDYIGGGAHLSDGVESRCRPGHWSRPVNSDCSGE